MSDRSKKQWLAQWSHHDQEWRYPAQIASQWREAALTDPRLFEYAVRGAWWQILATHGVTLLVTREYEHLVMALSATRTGPAITFMPMPHPSGIAVDRARGIVHVGSTRNPNQVYDLRPATGLTPRRDIKLKPFKGRPLVPVRSRLLPGCLYLHDLALIGGELHANAVGLNAVVRLFDDGRFNRVWWPRCIAIAGGQGFSQNYIQLNSIAAGTDLATSYFTASGDKLSARRPGHKNYPVDKRGVIFSGATREPVVRSLTRPHSARLHQNRLWVANSGYGELGVVEKEHFVGVARLPGWTRGLCFHDGIAFAGTSHVIPRYSGYAPGLDVDASLCGVHAIEIRSGRILGSLVWPNGNQVFSVDWMPNSFSTGLPFTLRAPAGARETNLFYAFQTDSIPEPNE